MAYIPIPVAGDNAVSLPSAPVPLNLPLLRDAADTSGGTTRVASSITPGDIVVSPSLNRNAQMLELVARYSGGYGIASGLSVTVAALVATVAPGHALMDGVIELPDSRNVNLSDGENYLWLTQTGQVALMVNTTAPPLSSPARPAVYLGRITVAGGVAGAWNEYGVLYLRGGLLWRRTGDAGAPTDTPPATLMLWTRTQNGLYFWDGVQHTYYSSTGSTFYFGNVPFSSGNNATHDNYKPGGGVHLTDADRVKLTRAGALDTTARTSGDVLAVATPGDDPVWRSPDYERASCRSITASAAITGDDGIVFVDATGGNIVLTAPIATGTIWTPPSGGAPGKSRVVRVKRVDGGSNTVSISRSGQNIDGSASKTISPLEVLSLVSDGLNLWMV